MYQHLLIETSHGVATVRLNRPERLNALGSGPGSNRAELLSALQTADADPAVACLVVAAAGKAFCGGGDLTGGKPRANAFDDLGFLAEVERFHAGLRQLRKPVIAAVQGLCLGAGLALIAQCDVVVAADDARFGLVEGRIGLAGASFVQERVGAMWAKYLILTGEMIDAATAQRIGLVLELAPAAELQARVGDLAQRLARLPAESLALNKAGIEAQAEAAGRAAGRAVALAADTLTTAHAREARAPDGRRFRDILAAEGLEGLKRAREQQFTTPWLAPSSSRR